MADVQKVETRFYVGRVNKRQESVEVISYDDWNGLFSTNSQPVANQSFPDVQQANIVISALNNLYDKKGVTDFRCYLLRNIENITHVVGDIPEDFRLIFDAHFNPEEENPEDIPEDQTSE